MTENKNIPPNPASANLTPHEPAAYESALSEVIEETHYKLDGVGYPALSDQLDDCEDDVEVAEAFENYGPGLQETATEIEAVLFESSRQIPRILQQNEDDWDVYDEVESITSEKGLDGGKQFDSLDRVSSDVVKQAIRLTQDHLVLSEARLYLKHQLPSTDEFTTFVNKNASSPRTAQAIRTALDWDVWDLLPKNVHGQTFPEAERQARLSRLAYVSTPEVRADMVLALKDHEAYVRNEQYRVAAALHTKLGSATLHEAVEQQKNDPGQN